jgi:hypothetical protein
MSRDLTTVQTALWLFAGRSGLKEEEGEVRSRSIPAFSRSSPSDSGALFYGSSIAMLFLATSTSFEVKLKATGPIMQRLFLPKAKNGNDTGRSQHYDMGIKARARSGVMQSNL